jgi:hypothetical protein
VINETLSEEKTAIKKGPHTGGLPFKNIEKIIF